MFSEILKIDPRIENSDAAKLESALNRRFSNVAKKFGGGIVNSLKGYATVAGLTALVDKVLNPLQSVQEAIDRSLHAGDDLTTQAKQFNTTPGNLARLQAYGKSTGLDEQGVMTLLLKFQGAVAQSALHPDQATAVTSFVGRKDTAEAFFEFIQSMQKLPNEIQKTLVQQEVFGERQSGKSLGFLNANFSDLNGKFNAMGVPSSSRLTSAAKVLNQLNENKNVGLAGLDLRDLVTKSNSIGDNAINGMLGRAAFDTNRENANIQNFTGLEKLQHQMDRIAADLEHGLGAGGPALAKTVQLLPAALESIPEILEWMTSIAASGYKIEKARSLRGIAPGQGKDK